MKKGYFYLRIVCLIIILSLLSFQALADTSSSGASPIPDHITLTWNSNPATTQTVSWRTDMTVNSGTVQYKETATVEEAYLSAQAVSRVFSTTLGQENLYTITLTDLKPGTKYTYRVGDGNNNWSQWSSFSTENPTATSFKFIVFGDSQSGNTLVPNYQPWKTTLHNAFSANQDAKFIMNVGDLVETGQSYMHWNNWFDAAKGVIDTIPDMPAHGNHETLRADNLGCMKPVNWISLFALPQNGPEGIKNEVYSFDYNMVHFIILDSQQSEEAPKYGDLLEPQKKWLEDDLTATKKPWKIVLFHKTPYYNEATRTNEAIKAAFCPIFDKYHVDLVFNAHDHNVARTYFLNNDEFVSKPSQGTVYYITGRSGNKEYQSDVIKVWNAFYYNPLDQPNYLVVEASAQKLNIKAIKQDGTLIDDYTIDKINDTDIPKTVLPAKNSKPKLVIYGNLINPTTFKHEPLQKKHLWYVDLNSFVKYVHGTVSLNGNKVEVNLKGKTYTLANEQLITDKGILMASTEALKSLGFSTKFSKNTNLLLIAK